MSDALPAGKIEKVHGRVTRGGSLVELGTPATRVRDGYTVIDLPIAFEKVDLQGRVAFDPDGQMAGLIALPPDSP